MGKSSPSAPDYRGAAQETAQGNREMLEQQTYANRPDQHSPWGSTTWSNKQVWDPSTDQYVNKWTQREQLNDQTQGALDSQLGLLQGKSDLAGGMMGRVEGEFGNPMDWDQFGDMQGLEYNPEELRSRAEDAHYGRQTSRLDPQFEQQNSDMDIKLRNQGLTPGDEAYDRAMQNQTFRQNDAYEQARMGSILAGKGEAAQDFGQQQQTADYSNKLRQQQITEEMTKRGFSLNEINAIIHGQQVNNPQFQNFSNAGKVAGPDYSTAAMNQSNFDQMQAQSQNNMFGNVVGTGLQAASMFGFSDRRLKRNIQRIGVYLGYPLYLFEYLWGEVAVGVMSDEINQDAVFKHRTGYDMVDYSKIRSAVT